MPSRDSIDLLVCGFPARFRKRRPIVVLAGYADESQGDSIYTLAGWLSSADKWKQFSDAFDIALPRHFHMTKVRPAQHEGKKVRALAALACEHAMFRIDCTQHEENYLNLVRG